MEHTHLRGYFLAAITVLLLVLTVYLFRPFLVTLGLAAVFAVIFAPVQGRFMGTMRLSRPLAAVATLVFGLLVVAVPLGLLGIQLLSEAQNVYSSVSEPGSLARAQQSLGALASTVDGRLPGVGAYIQEASENLGTYLRVGLGWALGNLGDVFSGTLRFLLQFFVFMITLYYFLKDGPRVREAIARYSPLAPAETSSLLQRLTVTINSVVKGSLVIAIIQGVLTAIGFALFGVPNAVLWGTIAIIGALIPSVGTALVFIPAALYLLFIGSTGAAIGLGLYGLFGVGMIDNFIRPSLVGGRASIHPLLILLSVLGGIALLGPAGLFLGPLAISLLLGILAFYAPANEASTT